MILRLIISINIISRNIIKFIHCRMKIKKKKNNENIKLVVGGDKFVYKKWMEVFFLILIYISRLQLVNQHYY